jgi:hypothetical protein
MEKAGPATTMLGEAAKYIQDTSVLRRLMFATSVLPLFSGNLVMVVAFTSTIL